MVLAGIETTHFGSKTLARKVATRKELETVKWEHIKKQQKEKGKRQ